MSFRLLHCSDLHLGQRFHDQDRSADESHALDQLVEICRTRSVDVVVLAGDIFDMANPGAHEVARYHRFLAQLVLDVGVGTVVVIAGNHDNAKRIEGPRAIFEQCRIHTVGRLQLEDPVQDSVYRLRDREGREVGHCAAIPYLRDGDVRVPGRGEDPQTAARLHQQAISAHLARVHASVPKGQPLVVVAHAFVSKSVPAGDERPIQVGNLAHIPAADLAGDCSYLALGHLHRPQSIAGNDHWRYSGSLLPTGFDEIDCKRAVVLAEIPVKGPAQVERIDLESYREYRSIKGSEFEVLAAVKALPTPAAHGPAPWAKVQVRDDKIEVGLGQHLMGLAQDRGWQLLGVELRHQGLDGQGAVGHSAAPPIEDELADPDLVFGRLLRERVPAAENHAEYLASFADLRERCQDILNGTEI